MTLDNSTVISDGQVRSELIDELTLEEMKKNLGSLIIRHSAFKNIEGQNYELFLHDKTPIRFTLTEIEILDNFLNLVKNYGDYFRLLINNLSYESTSISQVSDRVIGPIDYEKTIRFNAYHKEKNVVCKINSKNLFIEENIFFAGLLLSIYILANRFLDDKPYDILLHKTAKYISNPERYEMRLKEIIQYMRFLLKDKLISKLVNYYLTNYDNIGTLENKLILRANTNKIKPQYQGLFKLIMEWQNYKWLLNQPLKSLRKELTEHFDLSTPFEIYEMWIFYKILEMFEVEQKGEKYVNVNSTISIEYQNGRPLDWKKVENDDEKEIVRRPDIVIEKDHKIVAIVDAKYMSYTEEIQDQKEIKRKYHSQTDVVNQMIIYLDHSHHCNYAFVLYVDYSFTGNIVLKQTESRQIHFLGCFPFKQSAEESFRKIKNHVLLQK